MITLPWTSFFKIGVSLYHQVFIVDLSGWVKNEDIVDVITQSIHMFLTNTSLIDQAVEFILVANSTSLTQDIASYSIFFGLFSQWNDDTLS